MGEENFVYVVFEQPDKNAGSLPVRVHSVWKYKTDANTFVDRQPGVQGQRREWSSLSHGDWEVRPYRLIRSLNEFEAEQNAALREQALAKLSSDERRALGL